MRILRSASIGSISAWLPSRRSTLHQTGGAVITRDGHCRSGKAIGANGRYLADGSMFIGVSHALRRCMRKRSPGVPGNVTGYCSKRGGVSYLRAGRSRSSSRPPGRGRSAGSAGRPARCRLRGSRRAIYNKIRAGAASATCRDGTQPAATRATSPSSRRVRRSRPRRGGRRPPRRVRSAAAAAPRRPAPARRRRCGGRTRGASPGSRNA